MLQQFAKIAGGAQGLLGLLGTALPGVTEAVGTAGGGNIFNLVSGAALSYLGFKGSADAQKTGAPIIAGLNGIVGLLGLFGISNIAGIQLNESSLANIINLAIGAWGLIATFMKKKA